MYASEKKNQRGAGDEAGLDIRYDCVIAKIFDK